MTNLDAVSAVRDALTLSDEEIKSYLDWIGALSEEHANTSGGPIDGASITFQFCPPFGVNVVAHTSRLDHNTGHTIRDCYS